MSNDLTRELEEIGSFLLDPDWDLRGRKREIVRAGPNKWLYVRGIAKYYGLNFDFRVLDRDVFMPTCIAAQHWLWYSVGEDQKWITIDGFSGCQVTEDMIRAAARDGLLSEETYELSMLNEELSLQGEGL